MKRAAHLTEQIAELDNLYLAFAKACRGKQRKAEVQRFRNRFDENIAMLRSQILAGQVDVGHYHFFTIHDPKQRTICAAPFAERVLHHALMNVCHPYFDRSLIDHTYATRPGKGVYEALNEARRAAVACRYMVKLDVRKYYDSINHGLLMNLLRRKFKDGRLLGIFGQIIDSYHAQTEGTGLPIGNLTSQYFANAYLSPLDHLAKEQLRARYYIRYMDDILMAADDRQLLMQQARQLAGYAHSALGLHMKPPICQGSAGGMSFLGYKVTPRALLLSGRSKRRFRSKLLLYERLLSEGTWCENDYEEHILPLLAFARHADSRLFRHSCIEVSAANRGGIHERV